MDVSSLSLFLSDALSFANSFLSFAFVDQLTCKNADHWQTVPLYSFLDLSLSLDSLVSSLLVWQEPIAEIEVLVVVTERDGDKKTRIGDEYMDSEVYEGIDDSDSEDQRSSSLPPASYLAGGQSLLGQQAPQHQQQQAMNYVVSGKLHTRYSLSLEQRRSLSPSRLISHSLSLCFLKAGHYSVQSFVKIHYHDPHFAEEDFGGNRNVWWTNENDIRILAVDGDIETTATLGTTGRE